MTQYRVSDREQRYYVGLRSYFDPGDIVDVSDIRRLDGDGEVDAYAGLVGGWILPSALDPVEATPDIGKVIRPDDIQVGDTIRVVQESQGIEMSRTLTVSAYDDIQQRADTLQGGTVYLYSDHTIYLIDRPIVDPEVQAIMDTLGVDVDTASDYHSKGIRATETPLPTPTA